MSGLNNLPVLILAYNRFDKFYKCINTLKDQGIKKIFISIDGPIDNNDIKNQKKILNYCKKINFNLDIKINFLGINHGCRIGPLKGISWFFEGNEYGVVLEDDVIISKNCMEAFYFLLKEKINNKKYMTISSFNEFTNKEKESLYSLPVWRSWGWASWADRWKNHIDFSKKIKDCNMWQLYRLLPSEYRSIETVKIIKACQLNLLDAWDYEFNFSHIVHQKSSLTIGGINNYVYGFDSSATHTYDINSIGINFSLFGEREINFDGEIIEDKKYYFDTLEKCGFNISKYQNKKKLIFDFLNFIISSFLLRLQKIKRIMFMN